MKRIEIDNKVLLFLDHRKLIDIAYNENVSQDSYTLRPELFDFRAKSSIETPDDVPKRKRKKIAATKAEDINPNYADNEELLFASQAIRAQEDLLPQIKKDCSDIPRFWEELTATDFPKFKGGNNTDTFQIIKNFVKNKSFVIPPKSLFYNYSIESLSVHLSDLPAPFDIIVLDPPWRNKYIRRLKRHHLGYNMLDNKELQDIPISRLIHKHSVVAIWCTNSKQHQEALLDQLLPSWHLRLLHTVKWLKLNTNGEPIGTCDSSGGGGVSHQKRPYEMLYICLPHDADEDFGLLVKEVDMILSVPSIIHSHKPPLLSFLQNYFPLYKNEPKCLELFGRYLQPYFTTFGLEVLKLMDQRLYDLNSTKKIAPR